MSSKKNPWKKLLNKVILCGSAQASRSRIKQVNITEQSLIDQWNKQNGKCYWLDIPMCIDDVYTSNNPFSPSVDRLDNNKDYDVDNIVICTGFANMGRGRVNEKVFRLFVEYLKNFYKDT
jgi:hypothetical protein